ncbi:unnamed protein product [Rotaria sp. Silwood1]|nr:unnamed protein product [Rotaria sp. Silwood1]CAF3409656.1 unnamed protein product [Rotaria sp. Silwood1]CAF4724374.1 unnamed protein product [Rotaria sp. Silwood1]
MAFGTNPFELHASNFLKQIRQKRQTKFNYGEIYGLPLSYGVTLPQSCCTSDVPTTFNSLDSYCISNANNMPNSFHPVGCLKILSKVAGDQTLGIAIINSCLLAFALAVIAILVKGYPGHTMHSHTYRSESLKTLPSQLRYGENNILNNKFRTSIINPNADYSIY